MHASSRSPAGRARLAMLSAAALAGTALPAAGLLASPASAAANPLCSLAGTTVTCTFSYNGSTNTNGTAIAWTVPAGVSSLTITADGAAGGNGAGGRGSALGGAGGEAKVIVAGSSLSGKTLSVFPGGIGGEGTPVNTPPLVTEPGGIDAGGSGGLGSFDNLGTFVNAGGGGASTVALSPFSIANLLVVGGGGGGGAINPSSNGPASGGAGGTSTSVNGGPGAGDPADVGGGGTELAGGTGGTSTAIGCPNGATGTAEQGGNGILSSTGCSAGAGGGGGYFGGGGSSNPNGGGGGGSAFPDTLTTFGSITDTPIVDSNTNPNNPLARNPANGFVTISFTRVRPVLTNVTAVKMPANSLLASATLTASGSPVAGERVTFTAGPYFLCTGVTNSRGVASCADIDARQVLNSLQKLVTATFSGDTDNFPATGTGPIIRFI